MVAYTLSRPKNHVKALLISNWNMDHCLEVAKQIKILTVTFFATGENLSLKSTPSTWLNLVATKQALYLSTFLLALTLTL